MTEAYKALASQPYWIHPKMKGTVDTGAVDAIIRNTKSLAVKLLVVPELGQKWRSGSTELRGAYAKWLFRKQLHLSDAVLVVGTQHGITAYSDRLPEAALLTLNNDAAKVGSASDMTPAFTSLIAAVVREQADARKAFGKQVDATSPQGLPEEKGSAVPLLATGGIIAVVVGLGWFATKRLRFSSSLTRARGYKDKAINGIAYLDGYMDLLPEGEAKRTLENERESAAAEFDTGLKLLERAATPNDTDGAILRFETAHQHVLAGKSVIEEATGGTSVAYAEAPAGFEDIDDPRIFQPVKNVCFFCSQPGKGDLTPVTINAHGQRKTVLACPRDLATLRSGQEPQVAGRTTNGTFVPWYGVQSYNPVTDYGSQSFLWDMLALSAIADAASSHHSHDDGGSGWTSPDPFGSPNLGGDWTTSTGSSSFDAGGGSWDAGGSFDSGGGSWDSGGGGFDSGGSGGGDF